MRQKKFFDLTLIHQTNMTPAPGAYQVSFISTLKFKTRSFQSLNFAHMRELFSTTNSTKQQHSGCKGVVLGHLDTCPSRKEGMTTRHQKPDLCLQVGEHPNISVPTYNILCLCSLIISSNKIFGRMIHVIN